MSKVVIIIANGSGRLPRYWCNLCSDTYSLWLYLQSEDLAADLSPNFIPVPVPTRLHSTTIPTE
ncbi:hypothetical protein PAXRUDRAFT_830456 [Paxillus rubicundulus Ve08.2h10]|uniref:Uncharacterized protein n=1 Tax=Paxillus rubicundulus Ve08.2h10 TaxID=930991 RepID=A0A0D0DYT2_9AGAM|nr:hypothetical protein PAXRUDRAFT_830456 [Paxillus rubicundulus Ve08.2h10]